MNLNDYRLNAYHNAARKNGEDAVTSGTEHKKIRKPVFEQLSGQPGKPFSSAAALPGGKTAYAAQRPETEHIPAENEVKAAAAALTSGGLLKVPAEPQEPDGRENIYRRVAKFLLLIGIDEAAKILPHLSESQTEKIIPEIASIRHIDPDEAASILAEFQSLVQRSREEGGIDTAKAILEKAFGEKKAGEMLQKAVPFARGKPFEYLDDIDADRIVFLLKDESAAVRSLVLSRLKPKTAAAVINALGPEDKKEVILRLAKMEPVLPEVLRRVDQSMHEKALAVNTEKANIVDGRGILAQILKRMTVKNEQQILGTLTDSDPELGQDLRQRLFTIEDIVNSDDRFLQELLRKTDDTSVALLIAGKPDSFRTKILHNVSKARGDAILEDEQLQKPVLRRDCEKITDQFLTSMRQAFEDGRLIVNNRSDDIFV